MPFGVLNPVDSMEKKRSMGRLVRSKRMDPAQLGSAGPVSGASQQTSLWGANYYSTPYRRFATTAAMLPHQRIFGRGNVNRVARRIRR